MSLLSPAATSEEALERYQQAHREGSIEGIASVIHFRQEAEAVLQREKRAKDGEAVASVAEIAAARESELRELYARRGFASGLNVGACKVITKFENSPVLHSFVLRDESRKNAVNVFSLAFHKHENGWFLVRGA